MRLIAIGIGLIIHAVTWLFADRTERNLMRRGTAADKFTRSLVSGRKASASMSVYEADKADLIAKADERKGDKKGAAKMREFAQMKRNSAANSLRDAIRLEKEANSDTRLTWPKWLKD
jgi:hypothetical protein